MRLRLEQTICGTTALVPYIVRLRLVLKAYQFERLVITKTAKAAVDKAPSAGVY